MREQIESAFDADQYATVDVLASEWLTSHPNDVQVLVWRAHSRRRLGRYDLAHSDYCSAIESSDPSAQTSALFVDLGILEQSRGSISNAVDWFTRAIDASPADATAYIFMGSMYALLGELDRAEGYLVRACDCETGAIDEAFLNRGLILRGLGRLAEAEQSLVRALALDPEYSAASLALDDVRLAIQVSRASDA